MNQAIGIAGIAGRMGRLLTEEVIAAGATLAGGIDRPGVTVEETTLFPDIVALAAACGVVLDFSHASTAAAHAPALAAAGTAWVLGTTGLSAADEAAVTETARHVPVVYAPNFSTGVNLVLALAERMAAALPADQYDAEIVEMHHRQKVDAPSGTAIGARAGGGERARSGAGGGKGQRTRRPYRRAAHRRDRLRGAARRAGGGRTHAVVCRRDGAYRA